MKKSILLAVILISSLTAFSQSVTDTSKIPVKCFPIPVAKAIAKDLLKGDSAVNLLKLTEDQLKEMENKVALKDSIIYSMKVKEKNFEEIIEAERKKYELMAEFSESLKKSLRKEKVKNKFTKIVSSGAIVALGVLFILK